MLKIQPAQIRACDEVARATFVTRLKDHLKKHFPDEFEQLGDAESVKLIESGLDKAARHSIEAEEGVAKFVTLMLAYGADFDEQARHTWARAVLGRQDLDDNPILKADLLYEAGIEQARIDEGISKAEPEDPVEDVSEEMLPAEQ